MTQAAARSAGTFGGTFDSPDPATGAVVASFPVMGPDEVRAVVARARIVGHWWASQPHAVRRAALLAWAAYLVRHSGVLVGLVSREQGKSRDEAYLELVPALEQIRWAARHAAGVLRRRRVLPNLPMANHLAEVEYQPYGVVGVIGPWNYPLFTPAGMIGYALAAGNAVVLKPSEHTTAVGEYLVLAFALANPGLPDGLLGLVTGMGPTGGALIDSGVDKVAFTGSPATGRQVMAACARSLTPLVLECGGKDPMIVADDADLAAAAKAAIWGGMANSGQTCVGIERVYVVASVRDRFLAELQRQLGGVRAGPGPGSAYGPMSTPQQFEIVRRQVDEALDAGAIPLVGGRTSMDRPFIGPVVLVDPPDTCSVMTEETFGPVLAVRTVADTDEAVRLANDGRYGLGASVFSRHHGKDIARRIASGMVAVNCGLAFVGIPGLPFGGQGESGFGRIHGAEGLREFARPRSYTEQKFAVPGMDVATLRPREATMRAVRLLMTVRHGQIARRAVSRGQFAREKGR